MQGPSPHTQGGEEEEEERGGGDGAGHKPQAATTLAATRKEMQGDIVGSAKGESPQDGL